MIRLPAYFSVEFLFEQGIIYPNFVRDIYSSFFISGFDFKSGFWFHESATLDEIINWNQMLLERKFRLGLRQHVKHDYMHMLLKTDLFKEMRLYWLYFENEFQLHLIVPEYDILHDVDGIIFIKEKLDKMIGVSKSVWETGLVKILQTCLEFNDSCSFREISKGQKPSINPFCIVKEDLFSKFCNCLPNNIDITSISNSSFLLIDKSCIIEK